jgi:hypothetical protein
LSNPNSILYSSYYFVSGFSFVCFQKRITGKSIQHSALHIEIRDVLQIAGRAVDGEMQGFTGYRLQFAGQFLFRVRDIDLAFRIS